MAKKRLETLAEKPFSVCLSSGFFGFFAHAGFTKALDEFHLKPSLCGGSSAGAIIAACLAHEIPQQDLEKILLSLKKSDFWDPSLGFGLLKGEKLEKLLMSYLPSDFSDLAKPLKISVFDIFFRKAVTVETGSIAKACRASCAVPFLFHPVRINNRLYWDGGILAKPGAFGVSDQQPIVYHYLDATDVVSAYEDRKIYRHHHDTPYFLKISGVPSSGPNKLHRGKEILDYAYYKTKEWLGEEISLPGAETR